MLTKEIKYGRIRSDTEQTTGNSSRKLTRNHILKYHYIISYDHCCDQRKIG